MAEENKVETITHAESEEISDFAFMAGVRAGFNMAFREAYFLSLILFLLFVAVNRLLSTE